MLDNESGLFAFMWFLSQISIERERERESFPYMFFFLVVPSSCREGLEVTDDVSIIEHLKHPVYITEGSYTNIKVVK